MQPDGIEHVEKLLEEVRRTIKDNSQFLKMLSDDSLDDEAGEDVADDNREESSEEYEEL